jgi:hypothetical protein
MRPIVRALGSTALIALAGPASATHDWDYTCKANDKALAIDASVFFGAGTIGPISVKEASIALKPGSAAGKDAPDATFTHEEVEQFWTDSDRFMLSVSTYIGDAPETARLLFDTRCKDLKCDGTYRFTWKGEPVTGKLVCEQSEAG